MCLFNRMYVYISLHNTNTQSMPSFCTVQNLNPPQRKLTMNEEATTVQATQPPSSLPELILRCFWIFSKFDLYLGIQIEKLENHDQSIRGFCCLRSVAQLTPLHIWKECFIWAFDMRLCPSRHHYLLIRPDAPSVTTNAK